MQWSLGWNYAVMKNKSGFVKQCEVMCLKIFEPEINMSVIPQ